MKAALKILLIATLVGKIAACNSQTIPLDSILAVIKQNNPNVKKYGARAEAMRARAQGAGSWMAPEVGGGLWMVPYKRVTDARDKGQVMISVQQKFINPAKLRAERIFQESASAVEQANATLTFNELRADARRAYARWILYAKKKNVLAKSAQAIKLIQQIANAKMPYDQKNPGPIYKIIARAEEIRNETTMNDNLIHQQNIRLDQLMNISTSVRFEIDTVFEVSKFTEDIDSALLFERRSDVKQIDRSLQSIRLSQALERTRSKPDFNLSFSHMIARGTGMPNQFMLLGMVTIPIAPWSSRGYKASIAAGDRDLEALKYVRSAIVSEGMGNFTSLSADIATMREQVTNYEARILPALQRNFEVEALGWREGNEDLGLALDALEALNIMQLQYLDAVLKLNETFIDLKKELEE